MRKQVKAIAVRSMLVLLAITAVLGAATFVIGVYNSVQGKILATLCILIGLCIGVLCNALLFETKYSKIGIAGVIATALTVASMLFLDWWDYEATSDNPMLLDPLMRFAGATAIFSLASVLISLLIHLTRQGAKVVNMALWTVTSLIVLDASIIALLCIDSNDFGGNDTVLRLLGATAIIATVGVIGLPIFSRLTTPKNEVIAQPE